MLYVVPTPIGNLSDISLRALEVLKQVDLILSEDTRVSGRLLKHFGITKPLKAYHNHNEHYVVEGIINVLSEGQSAALISDAGTPSISDPGYLLVRECIHADIKVECLPGATALIPALVVSGLPCDRFHFEGFLPHRKGRRKRLEYLSVIPHTFIIYESPHRIGRTLKQLSEVIPADRRACLCRELSKLHEEIVRGSLADLVAWSDQKGKIKGEIVLVVGPPISDSS